MSDTTRVAQNMALGRSIPFANKRLYDMYISKDKARENMLLEVAVLNQSAIRSRTESCRMFLLSSKVRS
jgi:hypothetical protein